MLTNLTLRRVTEKIKRREVGERCLMELREALLIRGCACRGSFKFVRTVRETVAIGRLIRERNCKSPVATEMSFPVAAGTRVLIQTTTPARRKWRVHVRPGLRAWHVYGAVRVPVPRAAKTASRAVRNNIRGGSSSGERRRRIYAGDISIECVA